MAMIDEKDREIIRNMFSEQMQGKAYIRFFNSNENCDHCDDTKSILEELTELSENIDLQIVDSGNTEEVNRYGVDKYPAIVFVKDDGTDTGVRFYGIPSGYEFSTLIEDIIDIANDKTALTQATIDALAKIDEDVTITVFVTPTCPHCPRAVRVAHHMAMVNPHIRGEMVEAMEFPELSSKHNVYGVPKTVINYGKAEQEGAVPEDVILQKILEALQ